MKKRWENRGCLGCCFYTAVVADFMLLLLLCYVAAAAAAVALAAAKREGRERVWEVWMKRERVLSNEIDLFIPLLFIAPFLP